MGGQSTKGQGVIAIGSDHAGFQMKEAIKRYLEEWKLAYEDLGPSDEASVDYPVFGERVAMAVASGRAERGIVICGSGIGISIAANKVKGIRAALVHDPHTAYLSRAHNDANVLALGGRLIKEELAREIVKKWLDTPFEGGRHQKRLDLIKGMEEKCS